MTMTDTKTNPSVPFEPLWTLAADKASGPYATAATALTVTLFSEMIGFDPRAVSRWRYENRIPYVSADRAACKMGYPPVLVWGMDWLNVKGDYAEIAAGRLDRQIEAAWRRADAITVQEAIDAAAEDVA